MINLLSKEIYMKKILTLILCLMFLGVNATFAAESNSTENAVQNKTTVEKQKVKRCPCKKIFEKTLGLTPEQIKLADKNRADEKKELLPYFRDVEVLGSETRSNIYAICKKPIRWSSSDYKKALNTEFNMTYPNGFKHNKHKNLVKTILNNIV